MSRGPGVAQRRIIQAVNNKRVAYLAYLTDGVGAEYKSLYRAACRLHDKGVIGLLICRYGNPKVIIHHRDYDPRANDLAQLRRELTGEHRR